MFECSSLMNVEHPNVVSVFLNKGRKLHTTRSWDFLRLERNVVVPSESLWNKAKFGEDTIIGNLDTGKVSIFFLFFQSISLHEILGYF